MRNTAFVLIALLVNSSCSVWDSWDEKPELTSPCAGIEGSPCGPKRPVNLWLREGGEIYKLPS